MDQAFRNQLSLNQTALNDEASTLLRRVSDEPDRISPSLYETGRLIRFAPWLEGHSQRIQFLLEQQNEAGHWGEIADYALVPTLSAVDALLDAIQGELPEAIDRSRCTQSLQRGLSALDSLFKNGTAGQFPDTIAAELIIPALIETIHDQLAQLDVAQLSALQDWTTYRLGTVDNTDPELLASIQAALPKVSAKLQHTLELFGDHARELDTITPVNGNVGLSPAATAAWLGRDHGRGTAAQQHESSFQDAAQAYLADIAEVHNGPSPGVYPISRFCYAWPTAALLSVGLKPEVPSEIQEALRAALTAEGASVAPGLVPEVDTTAMVLYALSQLGELHRPDMLLHFSAGSHFHLWPGERNPSVSANAHALLTLADYANQKPAECADFEPHIKEVTHWLLDRQTPEGCWWDKWHASPFYATAVTVQALGLQGTGTDVHTAVEPLHRATQWVLANQRPDGGWGWFESTAEETAYAVQILLRDDQTRSQDGVEAAQRSIAVLQSMDNSSEKAQHVPLWHDKDLYVPYPVIDAEVLAARHLISQHTTSAAGS